MNKMQATQGISIPRSGHSAVFHIAAAYFGDEFVYCDTNYHKHCGCGSVPCVNPLRTFGKNHDFGLREPHMFDRFPVIRWIWDERKRPSPFKTKGLPIIADEHYFIQYRSPVRAITSNFSLYKKKNPNSNHRARWERFAMVELSYWIRFVDKWILRFPPQASQPLYCSYEALVDQPDEQIRKILTYFSQQPLDEARVAAVLQKHPIVDRNSLAGFEFYDPDFFRKLEEPAISRMQKLNLPSFEAAC